MGDFRSMDPIFKGCYGDSFLYSNVDLGRLQQWEIHLPPYQGEIPTPPASFYLQAKQSEATKRSPMQAMMLTMPAESPKTKSSSGKGGHHHSSGCGLNTSTPKHPDSTSAKKPSSPKEQVPKEQDKSPRVTALTNAAGPQLHLPSQMNVSGRRPTQKTPANSTPLSPLAPLGLMASTVQWGPTAKQLSSNLLPSL